MNKNYYAIIPANVRYDKDLTPNAKLLYGELTALSNEKGYCWASNSYFSELYGVSKKTVSNWIASLDEKGFVKSEMIYKENSKEIKERRLYINPMENNFATYGRKFPNLWKIISIPLWKIISIPLWKIISIPLWKKRLRIIIHLLIIHLIIQEI